MRAESKDDVRHPSPTAPEDASGGPETYCAPAILWEQPFVALATCSFNPCLCTPPPPYCSGG